jgi:hypothetical protein
MKRRKMKNNHPIMLISDMTMGTDMKFTVRDGETVTLAGIRLTAGDYEIKRG